MNSADNHILHVLVTHREQLLQDMINTAVMRSTDHSAEGERGMMVEQMLRGALMVLEEALRGESRELRESMLETALPSLVEAGGISWEDILYNGLACWSVVLGRMTLAVDEEYRDVCIRRIAYFIGDWWRDISKALLPLFKARGEI